MGSKGSQTTTSSSAPPQAIMNAYQSALGMAAQATSKPYQQYTGQMVAGLSPQQQTGISNIDAAQGMALPAIQQGMNYTTQAAQGITPGLYARFYSPYVNDVANATQANLMESNAQQLSGLKGGAIQAGAFGGDRAGIAAAEMARQQNLAMGQTMGNIYQQGYGQAMGLAGQQVQNLAQMGQQIAGLGAGAQTSAIQGGQADIAAGAQAQATQQAQLQALYDQYQQYQAYPYQQAQFFGNIAEGIGAGSGGTSTTSTPGPSLASTIFGGLGVLGSISDRNAKENIHPVGKLNDGQIIYRFNYKGDPKTHIGLIAQEVEHHHPESVGEVNGLKAVNYDTATRDAIAKAFGGGLGAGRPAFAYGGIPYLTADGEGTIGWIPKARHNVEFNKSPNLPPHPPEYQDQPLDKSWGDLTPLSPAQVAGLKGLVGKVIPPSGTTPSGLGPTDSVGAYSDTAYAPVFRAGGLVRNHFANGGLSGIDDSVTNAPAASSDVATGVSPPPAAPSPTSDRTTVNSPSDAIAKAKQMISGLFSGPTTAPGTNEPHTRTPIENILGRDLSPEARAGILNGSFALMASRSPWFGQAVGDAGKVGMQTYYNALGQQRDLAEKAANIGEAGARTNLDTAQAEAAKATAAKTHFEATGEDLKNYYMAKAASPDPDHFMSLQDWVDQNGEKALAAGMGRTGQIAPQIMSAPVAPPFDPKAQSVDIPAPGNTMASEKGPDANVVGTYPAINKQITALSQKLQHEVGSPFYDQDYKNYMALMDQRKAIEDSPGFKAMSQFRNDDPTMKMALNAYAELNAGYDGAALARQKSMIANIAQQAGLQSLLPANFEKSEGKAAYDQMLKAQADIIGVLGSRSAISEGAPAASLGLESARVPGPDADPQARRAVVVKLKALQDYNRDLYNTWGQDLNWAQHQQQFSINHPISEYLAYADKQVPAASTSPTPQQLTKIQQEHISDLTSKFPNEKEGKIATFKDGTVYQMRNGSWEPK